MMYNWRFIRVGMFVLLLFALILADSHEGYAASIGANEYLSISCTYNPLATLEPPTGAQNFRIVAEYGGMVGRGVAIRHGLVYTGLGLRFAIIEANYPEPTVVGQTEFLGDTVYDVVIKGNYAYLATGMSGIKIIDISDPTRPTIVGEEDTLGTAVDISVRLPYLYIADREGGFHIVDASDPTHPVTVSTFWKPGIWKRVYAVAVYKGHAYLAVGRRGIRVLDISDPENLYEVGNYEWGDWTYDLGVYDGYLYALQKAYPSRLDIFDVSEPDTLILKTVYELPDTPWSMHFIMNRAYLAMGRSGVLVLDLTYPLSPQKIDEYVPYNCVRNVIADERYIYIADGNEGFIAYPRMQLIEPNDAGQYKAKYPIIDVKVAGNNMYVLDSNSSLHILLIEDMASPTPLFSISRLYGARAFALLETNGWPYAYVAAGKHIYIVELQPGITPERIHSYKTPGTALNVTIYGHYAYIADGGAGLIILDISDPEHPKEVGVYNTAGVATDVVVIRNYAYIADGSGGLSIVDVSDPSKPSQVQRYDHFPHPWTGYRAIAVSGHYAYMAAGLDGIDIIDITDPSNPKLVGTYNTPGRAWDVAIRYQYIFVADGDNGIVVLDASDPQHPVEVQHRETRGYTWRISLISELLYAADGEAGVRVISVFSDKPNNNKAFIPVPQNNGRLIIIGEYLYVVDDSFVVNIYHIRNGSDIRHVGTYRISGVSIYESMFSLHTKGNMLIVVTTKGVYILDVSVPASPKKVVTYKIQEGNYDEWNTTILDTTLDDGRLYLLLRISSTHTTTWTIARIELRRHDTQMIYLDIQIKSQPESIYAHGGRLFVWQYNGIYIFDQKDGAIVGYIPKPSFHPLISRIIGDKEYMYVFYRLPDSDLAISVMDISSSPIVKRLASYVSHFLSPDVQARVADKRLYFTSQWENRLEVVDVSDPLYPRKIGAYNLPEGPTDFVTKDNFIYLLSGSGIHVVNLAQKPPSTLQLTGTFTGRGDAVVRTGFVYTINMETGLHVFSHKAPDKITEVAHVNIEGSPEKMQIVGDLAYIAAGEGGLRIFDISNPYAPVEIGVYKTPDLGYVRDVDVVGHNAYVITPESGLHILDVLNPREPTELSRLEMLGGQELAISQKYAYISGQWWSVDGTSFYKDDELRIIDVSNVRAPREVGHDLTLGGKNMIISENLLLYVDGFSEMNVVDISNPLSPKRLSFWPRFPSVGITDIAIWRNSAYVTCGPRGLYAVNLSDPARPADVGFYHVGQQWAHEVNVTGRYIYLADQVLGLLVLESTMPHYYFPTLSSFKGINVR